MHRLKAISINSPTISKVNENLRTVFPTPRHSHNHHGVDGLTEWSEAFIATSRVGFKPRRLATMSQLGFTIPRRDHLLSASSSHPPSTSSSTTHDIRNDPGESFWLAQNEKPKEIPTADLRRLLLIPLCGRHGHVIAFSHINLRMTCYDVGLMLLLSYNTLSLSAWKISWDFTLQ